MNGYKIRSGKFDWMGTKTDGWLVFDTIGPETLVATIFSGDSGRVLKDELIKAGATEEGD
jgi:hypothetical protein